MPTVLTLPVELSVEPVIVAPVIAPVELINPPVNKLPPVILALALIILEVSEVVTLILLAAKLPEVLN
jgi:hypothetical protein